MPRLRPDDAVRSSAPVLRTLALGAAVLLGAVAVWLIVTGTTQKSIEIGVLTGLWGLLLASYSVFGARQARGPAESGRELDVRPHGVVDTRESAAERRAYEYRLEEMLRRQIQAAMASEVANLRSEVSALRNDFVEKVGGQLRLERIETTRLIGSNLEALQHEVRQVAGHPTVDAEPYSHYDHYDAPVEPSYPYALESGTTGAPASADVGFSDFRFTPDPAGAQTAVPAPPSAAPPLFDSPATSTPSWDAATPSFFQPPQPSQPSTPLPQLPQPSSPEFESATPSFFQPSTPLYESSSVPPPWEPDAPVTPPWEAATPLFASPTPSFEPATPDFDSHLVSFGPSTPTWEPDPVARPPWEPSSLSLPGSTPSFEPSQSSTPLFDSPLSSGNPLFEPSTPLFDAATPRFEPSTPLFDASSAAAKPLFESFLNPGLAAEPTPQPPAPADPFADLPRLSRYTDIDADPPAAYPSSSNGYTATNGYGSEAANGRHSPSTANGAPPPNGGGRRRREADEPNDVLSQVFEREGVQRY